MLDALPETVLQEGDVAVIGARRNVLLGEGSRLGEEVEDRELLDFPMAALDVVVTNKEVSDRTLEEIAGITGEVWSS